MTHVVALDTSVSVPAVIETHPQFELVTAWLSDRDAVLSGHAFAETYSILTRLPGDARLSAAQARTVIEGSFGEPAVLDASRSRAIVRVMADAEVRGGAVYDALVGLAARENGLVLATRDSRAMRTYAALGVAVELVA